MALNQMRKTMYTGPEFCAVSDCAASQDRGNLQASAGIKQRPSNLQNQCRYHFLPQGNLYQFTNVSISTQLDSICLSCQCIVWVVSNNSPLNYSIFGEK